MKSKISSNKCHNINTNNKNDKISESAPSDSNNNKGNCIDSNEGNSNSNNNNNSSSKENNISSSNINSKVNIKKINNNSKVNNINSNGGNNITTNKQNQTSNEGNSSSNKTTIAVAKKTTSTVVTSIARLVKLHLFSEIVL